MAKTTEKFVISDEVYIYKAENSSRWFARFKVGKQWVAKTTKEKDQQKAIIKAYQLQAEYQTKVDNNLPIFIGAKAKANTFKAIAKKAIKRMKAETANGTGKVIFYDYILALKKYHIPYFGEFNISDIDALALKDFDAWRIEKLTRVPAKSTINTHNAAMQRILDEAVIRNLITHTEVPKLKNNGEAGGRRAAFTYDEWLMIKAYAERWIHKGRKEMTRKTRKLLYYYIQFAILTGVRPGKEIDRLTWGDVRTEMSKGQAYTLISIRKGKTTKYTGTRTIVPQSDCDDVLKGLKRFNKKQKDDDLIFAIDGKKSSELGRNFSMILEKLNMKNHPDGARTLYSLRHTYITWKIMEGTNLSVLATQCGTSVEMIERHYKHLQPIMHAEQLANIPDDSELTTSEMDLEVVVDMGDGKIFRADKLPRNSSKKWPN